MVIYIYVFSLIISIYALYFGALNVRNSPKKIRVIISIIILGLFLRYISLIILFFIKDIQYLYLLKVFYFLYLICIPLGAAVAVFILTRSSIFKFNHIILLGSVLIGMYLIIMYKCPVNITIADNFSLGYIISIFQDYWYVDWIYMLINIISLLVAITQLNNRNSYTLGLYIVIIASLLTIVERVIWNINIIIFPQYLFGEIVWLMAIVYSLLKVSRK